MARKKAKSIDEMSLPELVVAHLAALDKGKRQYKLGRTLEEKIVAKAKPGEAISLPDGRKAVVVDMFAKKNVAFGRAPAFNRYQVEVSEAEADF